MQMIACYLNKNNENGANVGKWQKDLCNHVRCEPTSTKIFIVFDFGC